MISEGHMILKYTWGEKLHIHHRPLKALLNIYMKNREGCPWWVAKIGDKQ